jgi:hypothetical protein
MYIYYYILYFINYFTPKIKIIEIKHYKTHSFLFFKYENIIKKIGIIKPINKKWSYSKLLKKIEELMEMKKITLFSHNNEVNEKLKTLLPYHLTTNLEICLGFKKKWLEMDKTFNLFNFETEEQINTKNNFISLK